MRVAWNTVSILSVFALGYLAGSAHWSGSTVAKAQFGGDPASDEIAKSITAAYSSLQTVRNNLNQDGRYNPATKVMNVSALMAGGIDAIDDLEAGRGVDPETFAALYAGHGLDEVAIELDTDENGRLTYKGKVIRMYSIERLKKMFQERLKYSGEDEEDTGF